MPSHLHTGTTNSSGAHTHNYQDAYFAENIGGGANNVFGTNGGTDTDNSFIGELQEEVILLLHQI